ncbi:hypothetical protein LguiA_016454 [Lonicera macranthoides]
MSILQFSLSIPISSSQSLSSTRILSGETPLSLLTKLSRLSLITTSTSYKPGTIRMGGGPRTYPGGVSKWQWKRMQAKKSKQLLKARLARERQIYEMRKRAELQAAVTELERPWEVVEKAPTLFSATADEQVKVLADRFQKPGGFDLWSDKDGPQLFETVDGLPSSRFFPKGVVHSIRPYGRIGDKPSKSSNTELGEIRVQSSELPDERNINGFRGKFRKQRNNRRKELGSNEEPRIGRIPNGGMIRRRGNKDSAQKRRFKGSNSEVVYDMNLQQDGSYEFHEEN